ncbi:unnamed protein product [Thlaspi arvense]|uniref:RING-type E3 ubiquitin transferase n=1 Tax=Thlaspi arvense TaxID=13288 RepID=A0AAU9ST51_THLAR|nr:unnamed protein product [Thlaspi arvense]
MADSTSDATAANADTLKNELSKILTEIFSYGGEIKDRGETDGSLGVLKAIDEAITILTSLREIESKKPESDISTSASLPEVPKVFKCTLSNAIMIEPVVIASGQTYEKSYITQWLNYENKCPKTGEVLSNTLWTRNHLVDELITQWCRDFKYDRLKPPDEIVTELSEDGIESLLERISSPSSDEDQREASKELRRQTKKFPNVRHFFGSEDKIARLLSPLSALDNTVNSEPELHEDIVTALFNISDDEKSKTAIARNSLAIPLLKKSLRQGTMKARRNSAATLLSVLASDDSYATSKLLEPLVHLISEGDLLGTVEAATLVFKLRLLPRESYKPAISALIRKIVKGNHARELFVVLAWFSALEETIFIMEDKEFTEHLFSFLRKPSCCSMTCENGLVIVLNMLSLSHKNSVKTSLAVVDEEELKYGTFTKLAKQGSDGVAGIAKVILQWIKRFGSGKEPLLGRRNC